MEKDKSDSKNSSETLEDEIKNAVETGRDVKKTVQRITLKALTEGKLDTEAVRQVASAVVKGAGLGAASHGPEAKEVLAKAISGLDEALSSAAEASKLALEEAAGHLKAFGKQDLKQATDDLLALEEMYLDTLKHVAKGSDEVISSTLNDLVQHARHSGTAVGRRSSEIVEMLNRELGQSLSETVAAGADSALNVASQLSHAAAGFLDGIAQTLDTKLKERNSGNKE